MSIKILVIGNGPSVLECERGNEIDNFPGIVVRLNQYKIQGYEKYTGSRTDIYSCGGPFNIENAKKDYILVIIYMTMYCREYYEKFQKANIDNICHVISKKEIIDLKKEVGNEHYAFPTTGLITINSFLIRNFDVYIHGFDFFEKGAHYFNSAEQKVYNNCHEYDKEKYYVNKLIANNRIKLF